MPAPQASMFSQLARLSYRGAAAGAIAGIAARVAEAAALGVGGQGLDYEVYIDQISVAICSAWSQWQSMATMVGVIINAVTATGGVVVGPPWTPLIVARGPKQNPEATRMTNTIASVLGTAWLTFTASIKVVGMPWYPAFAAVPSPVAPPVPNIPCPVAALTSVDIPITSRVLAMQMAAMDATNSNEHRRVYAAIADAFEKIVSLWKVSTMVTNVLGTGPVPTFAPPYVPVGPVVGGVGTMLPGGFS